MLGIRCLSTEELQRRFGVHKVFVCDDPDDLAGALGRLREGTHLGTPLRIAVLATLMVKALLASFLGGITSKKYLTLGESGLVRMPKRQNIDKAILFDDFKFHPQRRYNQSPDCVVPWCTAGSRVVAEQGIDGCGRPSIKKTLGI
jgi:hypothetical protein